MPQMTCKAFLDELFEYKDDDHYILVWTNPGKLSRWFKTTANAAKYKVKAIRQFVKEVREGEFPARVNWNVMNEGELDKLKKMLDQK